MSGKVLVTGGTGFVGRKILEMHPDYVQLPSLRGMDEDALRRLTDGAAAVIHTAAISDMGECEQDPEAAWEANVLLPERLARAFGGKLVCFSSDQVYNGFYVGGPFTEENVKPEGVYANSKVEMEKRVLDIRPDAVMLRAEWMYDFVSPKGNYYLNMLAAQDEVTLAHEFRGVTYVREVGEAMEAVLKLPGGAYNFGSETRESIAEVTRRFFAAAGRNVAVRETGEGRNLWMDGSKARRFGVDFSDIYDGLIRCLNDAK